jgi:hypothetical protein
MYPYQMNDGQPDCRYVALPVCEPDVGAAPGSPINALALFEIRLRDSLDFTVDFSVWLGANGPAQLSAATWAAASGSPKVPTIIGQAFSPAGRVTAVISPGAGAAIGDTYWMDITATVAATTAVNPNDVALPARTLTRRVNIIVVNG